MWDDTKANAAAAFWIRALVGIPIAVAAVLSSGPSRAADDWEFFFAPYLLTPWISGDAAIGRAGAPIDVTPGDILDALNAGGMVRFEARHKSGFGASFDYAFMKLGQGASSSVGSIDADIFQGVLEAYATYRFDRGETIFDAYAGVRNWNIDVDLTITTGPLAGTVNRGGNWTDPVIGLRWQRRLNPKWRIMAQADVGGFGVASDFSWNVMGGFAYDRWENTSIFLMYRALSVDYETGVSGTPSYFKYDTVTQGPVVGVGFRF